jgi:hypothetical protein
VYPATSSEEEGRRRRAFSQSFIWDCRCHRWGKWLGLAAAETKARWGWQAACHQMGMAGCLPGQPRSVSRCVRLNSERATSEEIGFRGKPEGRTAAARGMHLALNPEPQPLALPSTTPLLPRLRCNKAFSLCRHCACGEPRSAPPPSHRTIMRALAPLPHARNPSRSRPCPAARGASSGESACS